MKEAENMASYFLKIGKQYVKMQVANTYSKHINLSTRKNPRPFIRKT